MNRTISAIALTLALAGCGQSDGSLTPGQWKTDITISKFEVPGAPPAMAAQIKTMLGKPQSNEACMNAAQAAAGVRDFSSAMQQGDCTMEDYKQGGGKMSGRVVCKNGAFGATTMQMEGTYTPEKVSMTMTGDVSDDKLPGGKASLGMTMSSERIGDCKS